MRWLSASAASGSAVTHGPVPFEATQQRMRLLAHTYNCATMNLSTLTAISPLDGRYAAKLSALRPIMSEYGYMHRRVQVEVTWFIALSDAGFAEFAPLSTESRDYLHALVAPRDAAALRAEIETMRDRVRSAHPVRGGLFDVKHSAGGMVDVEFAVQYLVRLDERSAQFEPEQVKPQRDAVLALWNAVFAKT